MKFIDFINKYIGKQVDFDGAFGAQCVDLFRQYEKEVLEIPEHTGAVEGARDLFLNYNTMPLEQKYFIRIAAHFGAEYGDIAVFDRTVGNKYGHVAIVLQQTSKSLLVFEQLGGTKDPSARLSWRSKQNLLGYLRLSDGC